MHEEKIHHKIKNILVEIKDDMAKAQHNATNDYNNKNRDNPSYKAVNRLGNNLSELKNLDLKSINIEHKVLHKMIADISTEGFILPPVFQEHEQAEQTFQHQEKVIEQIEGQLDTQNEHLPLKNILQQLEPHLLLLEKIVTHMIAEEERIKKELRHVEKDVHKMERVL